MRIPLDSLIELVERIQALAGLRLLVDSSLSRDRSRGHDRHVVTTLRFAFDARRFGWFISGGRVELSDQSAAWYSFDPSAVAAWRGLDGGGLEIIEHFEAKTERRTRLSVLGPIAPEPQ